MIRLFIKDISKAPEIRDKQYNYLINVMRCKEGDEILAFNEQEGEWIIEVKQILKKHLTFVAIEKIRDYEPSNIKLTLAFAIIKSANIDLIANKATELGINEFQPIITNNTVVRNMNYDRFRANAIESCEQCGRIDVPSVNEAVKLESILNHSNIILCDESRDEKRIKDIKDINNFNEIMVLIGPEGGFIKEERENMYNRDNIYPVSLGDNILRAETAVISAISIINEILK